MHTLEIDRIPSGGVLGIIAALRMAHRAQGQDQQADYANTTLGNHSVQMSLVGTAVPCRPPATSSVERGVQGTARPTQDFD